VIRGRGSAGGAAPAGSNLLSSGAGLSAGSRSSLADQAFPACQADPSHSLLEGRAATLTRSARSSGMRRMLMTIALVSAVVVAVVAASVGVALASFSGAAGELVYQDNYTYTDLLNNGAFTSDFYLTAVRAPGTGSGRLLGCSGGDTGTGGEGTVFCPETGVGFAPDGQTLVFAGFEARNDGTTSPDQSTCVDFCPQGLFLAGANGTDPHPLPVGVTDAEHPEFMPDGTTIIFAGKESAKAVSQLYTVGVDGGGLRRVTQAGGTNPAPCADGQVIYNRGPNLYGLNVNLKRSRRLTRDGGLADCAHDSRSLVFLRNRTLYTMTMGGRELRRLSPLGVASGRPTYSPAGGRIAYVEARTCTTGYCRSQTQGDGCDIVHYRLQVLDLRGRVRRSYLIGSNACTSDGDLGGDTFGQLAWQPLPPSR
jgi:WD40-like Beta Propeller Repeat